jgi:serine/threonine protein kinase
MTTEYMDKGTLRDMIQRKGKVPVDDAVPMVLEILAGLQACHARGIVHRDLKPENVLLHSSGWTKIGDLGIARDDKAPDLHVTDAGQVLGTPAYMAGEQLRAETVGPASDVYSAAAILYEMIAGSPPFKAASLLELMHLHEESRPLTLTETSGVFSSLSDLVDRALSEEIEQRPASADAFSIALRQSLRDRSIPPRPSPSGSVANRSGRTKARARSATWQSMGLCAAGGALAGGLAVFLVMRPTTTVAPPAISPPPSVAASQAPVSTQSSIWTTYRDAGQEHLKAGRHERAEKLFLAALKEARQLGGSPRRIADSHLLLARTYKEMGQDEPLSTHWHEAKRLFQEAAAAGDAEAERGLGILQAWGSPPPKPASAAPAPAVPPSTPAAPGSPAVPSSPAPR